MRSADKDSDFSTDYSQFDYRSDFSAPEPKAPEAEIPQSSTRQSAPTETETEEQQQEIRAQANEKAADEILKKRHEEQ